MTIQKDATTQPISTQQIADENAAAAEVNGLNTASSQPGASDNLDNGPELTPEQKQSAADIVQAQHKQQADDREAMMADLAARRRQHMREEHDELEQDLGLDNSDEDQENQEQEQETQAAQDVQAVQEEQPPADTGPRFFTDANGQSMVELMVNGKLQVVTQARVIAAAQKLEAGDERLRQAAAEREQLARERQALEQQKQTARQFQQPSVDPDAEAKLRTQLREGFERLVNEGDDNAMDALVDSLMKGRSPAIPAFDPHQIAAEAVIIQNQQAWDTALQRSAEQFDADPDFADVNGNEVLASRATQIAKELVAKYDARNRNVSPLEIMREAAITARNEAHQYAAALGLVPAAVPNGQTQQVASRADQVAARKTQAGNTVTGGSQVRVAPKEAGKVQDGGKNPNTRDAKVAAFAGLAAARTNPMIKR